MIRTMVILLAILTSHVSLATNEAGKNMVQQLEINQNLVLMAATAAQSTTTYQMIKEALGAEKAEHVLLQELSRVAKKYQDQWDENLGDAYTTVLSDAEMDDIAVKKQASKYATKILAHQGAVANVMRAKSHQLFQTYLAESLNNLFNAHAPETADGGEQ